ncbi:25S rRNA (adenine645-N1)-methyltransferase [Entomortierella beljakovae]|nr:25S rRNA (adenine645-N1)-methyltransferase [Entomortierella beljakovae]
MFAIPGFNVGNLVVEAPKEQLKKRKHDNVSTPISVASSASTTVTESNSTTPPVKKIKKDTETTTTTTNNTFNYWSKPSTTNDDKGTPATFASDNYETSDHIQLKDRPSWNRSTKEIRKAKAEEEKAKRQKALGGKKKSDKSGSNIESSTTDQTPKKRNKRLERKIKKAAYITALESSNGAASEDTTASNTQSAAGDESGDKKTAVTAPPELPKLTNKEKRLLKQFQRKQEEEGVDLAANAQPELLMPAVVKPKPEKKKAPAPVDSASKKAPTPVEATTKKSKKEKKAEAKATAPVSEEKKEPKAGKKKGDQSSIKSQQQLTEEREKLLEALNRTNSALAKLQSTFGDGEDDSPMTKADVKSAIQGKNEKKDKKEKKKEKAEASKPAPAVVAPTKQNQPKLTKLQEQMKKTLAGGKFRFLNEQLYTTTGEESFTLFQSKPELFDEYHEGFRSQVELWPENPVDIFIAELKRLPKDTVVADLGCGDAQISQELSKQYKNILSFDLVAKNDHVTACDIAHLPLKDSSVDVTIFCLSLMGTDFLKFLKEAYRVLKPGGQLRIAEVISRFTDVEAFVAALKALGFELKSSDTSNKMFILFDFIKPDGSSSKKGKKGSKKQKVDEDSAMMDIDEIDGASLLKPCIYKKR